MIFLVGAVSAFVPILMTPSSLYQLSPTPSSWPVRNWSTQACHQHPVPPPAPSIGLSGCMVHLSGHGTIPGKLHLHEHLLFPSSVCKKILSPHTGPLCQKGLDHYYLWPEEFIRLQNKTLSSEWKLLVWILEVWVALFRDIKIFYHLSRVLIFGSCCSLLNTF